MPPRREPMRPGGPLSRVPKARKAPDDGAEPPRPVPAPRRPLVSAWPKVSPEEKSAKRIVRHRSGGPCELECGRMAYHWSHRRAASQGGKWRAANGLDLCPQCHLVGVERLPLLADVGGWRIVHRDPDPATAPVWLPAREAREAGWWLLDDDGGMAGTPGGPAPIEAWQRIIGGSR